MTKPPRRIRSDGWTLPRQRCFIKLLSITGSVEQAARAAEMSASSAYRLRLHPDGAAFRRAWEAALQACPTSLPELAFDRALNGTAVPIIENGAFVGERAVFNDQLLMFLLRRYDRDPVRSPHQSLLDTLAALAPVDDPAPEMATAEVAVTDGPVASDSAAEAPDTAMDLGDKANPGLDLRSTYNSQYADLERVFT